MMTGTPSVNSIYLGYHTLTLLFLFLFAGYDQKHHKVRNAALLAFLPWCLVSILLELSMQLRKGNAASLRILSSGILGFLSGGLLLLTVSLATKGGIGGGDIKLVALLDICYGTDAILTILTVSCMAAFIHLTLKYVHKKGLPEKIPFVPYLAAGCTVQVLGMFTEAFLYPV